MVETKRDNGDGWAIVCARGAAARGGPAGTEFHGEGILAVTKGLGASSASAFNAGSRLGANKRAIAFMGDGGLWHNGLTSGIGNAVFNKHDNLFVIADNNYSAATGGQDTPSSRTVNPNRSTCTPSSARCAALVCNGCGRSRAPTTWLRRARRCTRRSPPRSPAPRSWSLKANACWTDNVASAPLLPSAWKPPARRQGGRRRVVPISLQDAQGSQPSTVERWHAGWRSRVLGWLQASQRLLHAAVLLAGRDDAGTSLATLREAALRDADGRALDQALPAMRLTAW
jgi:thiamine pyrophosphate-dependent enzyme